MRTTEAYFICNDGDIFSVPIKKIVSKIRVAADRSRENEPGYDDWRSFHFFSMAEDQSSAMYIEDYYVKSVKALSCYTDESKSKEDT
jgi:hypothetical protein